MPIEIPLQHGDIARRCPVRAQLDHTPEVAAERLPASEAQRDHRAALREQEAQILAAMRAGGLEVTDLGGDRDPTSALDALASAPQAVAAGRLPDDEHGRRTGRFDLLVRTTTAQGAVAWAPVIVRRHGLSQPGDPSRHELRSPLDRPDPAHASPAPGLRFRRNPLDRDTRDLAHQWRMLESAGLVPPDQVPLAGIIDRHLDLWWVDLSVPIWQTMWSQDSVSSLHRYDRAFADRIAVIERAIQRQTDPTLERRVTPVRVGECNQCPWELVCAREMEASDHVSLLPHTSFRQVAQHHERGVRTRAAVARLDWLTAKVLATANDADHPVDIPALVRQADEHPGHRSIADLVAELATHRPPDTVGDGSDAEPEGSATWDRCHRPEVAPTGDPGLLAHFGQAVVDLATGTPNGDSRDVVDDIAEGASPTGRNGRLPAFVRLLDRHGISEVGHLHHLDPLTLTYGEVATHDLPKAIDQARAATSHRPFRARDLPRILVRRADVEVDVDMENVEDGVYLWGTYTTLRDAGTESGGALGIRAGYRPFLSWEPMNAQTAGRVFIEFWTWLTALRTRCSDAGLTFAAYCYTTAEEDKMRHIIGEAPEMAGMPGLEEISAFTRSPDWVDLFRVAKESLVTGHGMGLKKLAPLAGFHWRDEDPGGVQSMYWHRVATTDPDPEVREQHRSRVLAYNEDDVLATLALRDWLDTDDLPAIESWVPPEQTGS